MSAISLENVKARATDIRTKVRTRIEEIRTGTSTGHSPLLGDQGLGLAKGALATEIRAKGLVATARDRITKVRGGGGGLLGGSSTSIAEKVAVEKDAGALKVQRRHIAIEA